MAACLAAGFGQAASLPAFKTGAYQGKTSPVLLQSPTGKIEREVSVVSIDIEPVGASACGGHGNATVLCMTNGGTAGGPTFGEWSTEDVGGGEKVCGSLSPSSDGIDGGWTLEFVVPKSGIVLVNENLPGDSGHVTAKIVVHKTKVITGTVKQFVNVSNASTNGAMKPLCTTGTWTFVAHFLG
ncbi:MAG TPA: hypothetical protein VH063_16025 [Gaiellaceae bacterium]|jgi:hypothetical protein|nr:hypothetical protein [Gaiellaceae bacterium]